MEEEHLSIVLFAQALAFKLLTIIQARAISVLPALLVGNQCKPKTHTLGKLPNNFHIRMTNFLLSKQMMTISGINHQMKVVEDNNNMDLTIDNNSI